MNSQIDEQLRKFKIDSPKTNFEPVDYINDVIEAIRADATNTSIAQIGNAESIGAKIGEIGHLLDQGGYIYGTEMLLVFSWNHFSQLQREIGKRVYKGNIGFNLTRFYLDHSDPGSAVRWAFLTHADDILGGHPKDGAAGKNFLITTLGFSPKILDWITKIAKAKVEAIRGNWSLPGAFAEDTLIEFIHQRNPHASLLALQSPKIEFPTNPAYLTSLINALDPEKKSTSEKGNRLEHLASYLFSLVPGWLPSRNLIPEEKTYENDLLVRNLFPTNHISAELLGRNFLVECKNWEEKVGSPVVGYFLYKMHLLHCPFGVIFSKKGITGGEDNKNANNLIARAFHNDNSLCIILSLKDIQNIAQEEFTFWQILIDKIKVAQFGD